MSRPRKIAIVIDLGWPLKYHHEAFAGVAQYARQAGWDTTILPHAETVEPPRGVASRFDGLVGRISAALWDRARRSGVPAVNLWSNSDARGIPSVLPDWSAAGQMAAEHLLTRGFRECTCLGLRRDRATERAWEGFRAAVEAGRGVAKLRQMPAQFDRRPREWEQFSHALAEWLGNWTTPIGVFAIGDLLARYFVEACHEAGRTIPDQVSVVGALNEQVICEHPAPSLSSVEFGYMRIGAEAARLLDEQFAGRAAPSEPVFIPPAGLIARQSSDALAVDDEQVAAALRYISKHCGQALDVDQVAAGVAAARRSLERRFQATLGRTIAHEITRLRLERVKRLLIESDAPIKTIARQSGFRDARRLCDVFRRVEGTTPGEYRESRRS